MIQNNIPKKNEKTADSYLNDLEALQLQLTGFLWELGAQSRMNKAHIMNMQSSSLSGEKALKDIDNHTEKINLLARTISQVLGKLQMTMAKTGEKTRESSNQLQDMTKKIDDESGRLDSLQLLLKEMSQRVSRAKEFIRSLEDITEKIDVLSINASIEAARAGDRGAGFKVVAAEIKRLALSSRKFSEQIIEELKSMDNHNTIIDGEMRNFQSGQIVLIEELMSGSVQWELCDREINEVLAEISTIAHMVEEQSEKTGRLNEKTEILLKKQEKDNRASLLIEGSFTRQEESLSQLTKSNESLREKLLFNKIHRQKESPRESSASQIRIGHDLAYPPWVYLHQGQSEGLSIDYCRKLAEKQKLELQFEADQWNSLLKKLDNGDIDLIANVGWPNKSLARGPYCPSLPYAQFEVCYFTAEMDSTLLEGTSRIYSQKGSFASDYIKQEEAERYYEDNDILNFVQLIWLKGDRVITDRSVGSYLSENYFSGQIKAERENEGYLDVVFLCREENRELLEKINDAIRSLGTLKKSSKMLSVS